MIEQGIFVMMEVGTEMVCLSSAGYLCDFWLFDPIIKIDQYACWVGKYQVFSSTILGSDGHAKGSCPILSYSILYSCISTDIVKARCGTL